MFTHPKTRLAIILTAICASLTASSTLACGRDKPYRVYTISTKCKQRALHGTYASAHEACVAAEELRPKVAGSAEVEIVTGSSSAVATPDARTAACTYEVYHRGCKRSDYRLLGTCFSPYETYKTAAKSEFTSVEIITRLGP